MNSNFSMIVIMADVQLIKMQVNHVVTIGQTAVFSVQSRRKSFHKIIIFNEMHYVNKLSDTFNCIAKIPNVLLEVRARDQRNGADAVFFPSTRTGKLEIAGLHHTNINKHKKGTNPGVDRFYQ